MRKERCFSYKKRDHTAYNCPGKGKITIILEDVGEGRDSQEKE